MTKEKGWFKYKELPEEIARFLPSESDIIKRLSGLLNEAA
jgi:hypothetical protein